MTDTTIVIALILLSGALPLVGLCRVALRAWKSLPDPDRSSVASQMANGKRTGLYPIEPIVNAARMADIAPVLEWSKVRWDLALVGTGIVFGMAGSIWGVFL